MKRQTRGRHKVDYAKLSIALLLAYSYGISMVPIWDTPMDNYAVLIGIMMP